MKPASILAAGTLIAGIASPAVAVGPQGQAVQINTYTDSICAKFGSNRMVYYGKSPKVGDCFDLNLADGVLSLNAVGVWGKDTSATKKGHCKVYSDFKCAGKQDIQRTYWPDGGPGCLNSRGPSGYLWKSAQCFVDN
ncbi:unnamed protein product [Clonostachys rhizophaga]|uniref:Uncharacterized protein n=1 Tax=Clonostachys rhizophaga TaxID=160324 RepID=A0A9N9VJB1_9HYPO|nr:unnamed protein product [Clonostachys rhizophaga]